MGIMAPGSAKFDGFYGGLPISFGPKDALLVLAVEDCEYYVSVTESKDSDGDGFPDCLGASGVSKDTVTVADAKAAATAAERANVRSLCVRTTTELAPFAPTASPAGISTQRISPRAGESRGPDTSSGDRS